MCGSEGGKIGSAVYTCVQAAFIYVYIIMNEYFINVGSVNVKLTVRSCISLGGSRATGNVSLVKSSVSSSLLLLESKTTRKQEKSGTRPNYHQNSLGITFRHIVWFYKYKDEAKLHLLQKKQKKHKTSLLRQV